MWNPNSWGFTLYPTLLITVHFCMAFRPWASVLQMTSPQSPGGDKAEFPDWGGTHQ